MAGLANHEAGYRAVPEESANSVKFNYTPGAILPINEDERPAGAWRVAAKAAAGSFP